MATAQREGKGKKERLRESKMEDQGDDKAAVVAVEGEDPIVFYSPPAGFITVSRRMREREKERNDASDDRSVSLFVIRLLYIFLSLGRGMILIILFNSPVIHLLLNPCLSFFLPSSFLLFALHCPNTVYSTKSDLIV